MDFLLVIDIILIICSVVLIISAMLFVVAIIFTSIQKEKNAYQKILILIFVFSIIGGDALGSTSSVEEKPEVYSPYSSTNKIESLQATAPQLGTVTISENLLNPWDNVAYNANEDIIYYSNDQSMNTSLTITLSATADTFNLSTGNTSLSWGDGINITLSPTQTSFIFTFNYFIEQGETSNDIVLEVYDNNSNVNSTTITIILDNTSPTDYLMTFNFVTFAGSCASFQLGNTSDASSNFFTYTVVIGNRYQNYSSDGLQQLCGILPGNYFVQSIAYDNVANGKFATNSNQELVQIAYEVETGLVTDKPWNPLPILDNFDPLILMILFWLIILIVFFRIVFPQKSGRGR